MSWLKRGPDKLERLLATSRLQEAMERIEPASEYERVRTAQGRIAHLMSPPSAPRVLCGGWRGPWVPAEPGLPVCRMCAAEMEKLSAGQVAS